MSHVREPGRHHRIVRDPVWNTIRVDPTAVRIIDTAAFQRLRYIRQLGLAHLVYPGATHTRFDHALGVYHLAVTALRLLRDRGPVDPAIWESAELVPYAALLHDIGHYAFSHAVEELEADVIPEDHEAVSARFFQSPELSEALRPLGPGAASRIHDVIRGTSSVPLRGLVSGSLDLDKMEYLRRDARFCGVPYGEVDVDRLLQGLVLLQDPGSGSWEVGLHEKAASTLESLLFAKYQMFRNVYWHHAVRAATVLYKRIVEEAVGAGLVTAEELVGPTDEELLYEVGRRADEEDGEVAERLATRWLPALRHRRLPKRSLELTAADLSGIELADWVGLDSHEKRAVEDELAREVDLEPGEVVIDFPVKRTMFSLDALILRRSGVVERLGQGGLPGVLDLPRVSEELYGAARVLRVFCFQRRELSAERVLAALSRAST
jgi:HD superfamily phosphohydrolase